MLTMSSFDSYLSLGFGRPLSVYNEPLNDELFIQLSQARDQTPFLAADMYLVSQVQLARVCHSDRDCPAEADRHR